MQTLDDPRPNAQALGLFLLFVAGSAATAGGVWLRAENGANWISISLLVSGAGFVLLGLFGPSGTLHWECDRARHIGTVVLFLVSSVAYLATAQWSGALLLGLIGLWLSSRI